MKQIIQTDGKQNPQNPNIHCVFFPVSFLEPTTTISTTTSTEETKVEITPPSAISVSASINLNNQMNSDIATSTESKPAGPEAVAAPVGTTEKPVEPVAPEGDVQVTTITVTQGYILISLWLSFSLDIFTLHLH